MTFWCPTLLVYPSLLHTHTVYSYLPGLAEGYYPRHYYARFFTARLSGTDKTALSFQAHLPCFLTGVDWWTIGKDTQTLLLPYSINCKPTFIYVACHHDRTVTPQPLWLTFSAPIFPVGEFEYFPDDVTHMNAHYFGSEGRECSTRAPAILYLGSFFPVALGKLAGAKMGVSPIVYARTLGAMKVTWHHSSL